MKRHTIISIFIIVIFLFVSFSILAFYYTQDFISRIDIKKTIYFDDIEFETQQEYGGEGIYVKRAVANIGTIYLENKGYFSENYEVPEIYACIKLKGSVNDYAKSQIEGNPLNINYPTQPIKVNVGEIKEIDLLAEYSGSATQGSLSKDNLDRILVYVMNKKERNPFDFENLYYQSTYNLCNNLESGSFNQPVEKQYTIQVN